MTPTEQLLVQLERAIAAAVAEAFAPMHALLDLIKRNQEASTAHNRELAACIRELREALEARIAAQDARDPSSQPPHPRSKPQ